MLTPSGGGSESDSPTNCNKTNTKEEEKNGNWFMKSLYVALDVIDKGMRVVRASQLSNLKDHVNGTTLFRKGWKEW